MAYYTLILGAGEGARLNSEIPKQFLEINGLPILMHSITTFYQAKPNAKILVGLSKDFILEWEAICSRYKFSIHHEVYIGGQSRSETVFLGLKKIQECNILSELDLVSIHDAARPFIKPEFILKLINKAKDNGSAIPIMKIKNSLREINQKLHSSNVSRNRENYVLTQTPQVFYFNSIFRSYEKLINSNIDVSQFFDDASVYDFFNKKTVHLTNGEEYNIKITTYIDYFISEKIYEFFKKLK